MAASTLLNFSPVRNFSTNFRRYGTEIDISASSLVFSTRAKFRTLTSRKSYLMFDRTANLRLYLPASSDDTIHPEVEMDKDNDELKVEMDKDNDELKEEGNEAQEAWKKTLETFKEEALKMKAMSEEAYEMYSKKAAEILKEKSETLKIQADKAREDLSVVAKQISEEGKVYLSEAAKNSPDSVKDVVETFASTDDLKEISTTREFYLGIPYGAFLFVGGFLSFMLTGSISAIRFGVILGGALLALSVASLRSWRSGKSSDLFVKGQAAITAIIFIREWRLFCQRKMFSTSLMILISGGMLAFYVYRIMIDGSSSIKPNSDNNSDT